MTTEQNPIPIRTRVKFLSSDGSANHGAIVGWLKSRNDGGHQIALIATRPPQATIIETVPANKITVIRLGVVEHRYINLEKALAEAFGWKNIKLVGDVLQGVPPDGCHSVRGEGVVPRWTREWGECGRLASHLSIGLHFGDKAIAASANFANNQMCASETLADHETVDDAVRCAIVGAAVAKLMVHHA